MTHRVFSLRRRLAIAYKEALQLRRDRFTFGMIIGIPVVQLLLFGYAINNDPKHLPTAFVPGEETIFTRSVESALRTSDYFRITGVMSEKDAENALKSGDVSFVINIPLTSPAAFCAAKSRLCSLRQTLRIPRLPQAPSAPCRASSSPC